jgi:lipopolysaccharide biosynthesis glycosyltransferase
MKTEDTIPVVFAANNYYMPYMSAAMQSVMENAGLDRNYIFFILHREIDNDSMDLLRKQTADFHQFSIEFIDVTPHIEKYNLFVSRHITIETYFRLLIPELLFNYKKAIYLDGDMICRVDIASLFDSVLKDNLLAAVRDTGVAWYYSPLPMNDIVFTVLSNLKNPDEYFCAGLTVFNIEAFRQTIPTEKLLQLAASREWPVHDQDILNVVAEGKTLLLPYCWNFMWTKLAKYLPEQLLKEYKQAEQNPKIIHYKPWVTENYISHFEHFWKYATRTPFIDVILERMKSKELIMNESFEERIITNISQRKGIGIRFILYDCLKAWLFRDKSKKHD